MARNVFPEDVHVGGNLTVAGTLPLHPRSRLEQSVLARFPVPWERFRVWDAYHTLLPGTPAADDLGLVGGAFGSAGPSLQTEDLKSAGATDKFARCSLQLPAEYDAGETIVVRMRAGMLTTVADGSATIDLACRKLDGEAGVGGDLVTTAAQSINSLVLADKDFVVTPTGLLPGDTLDLLLTLAINDAATATAVKGIVGLVELLCDIRG